MTAGFRIGVDLGGTKIEAAAIDRGGSVRERRRIATPVGDYAGTIDAVVGLVRGIEAALDGRMTVGIGIPGTLAAPTGLVKNANSTWLIGKPLGRDLEAALDRPVRLANDANCFALSEASDGSAAGCDSVFGVILGTGVGGGVVIGGRIVAGANSIAGEWGHNPLPWPRTDELPGPRCYCGQSGCIETFLSGPGLTADHQRHGGGHLDGADIAAGAASGDAACRATFDRYAERLARALASVINIIDPEVIVLGGGLSAIAELYDAVPRLWGRYVFSDEVVTRLLPPKHGDSSGVRGAAWLWRPEEAPEGPS
ncbi:MAG TPA: ROK family protein [Stellaceae bacterium]|nr:ROK family protein [Stellaceae bacterium]